MKVLLINGSPHPKGCIGTAFQIMVEEFALAGVETEIINVGNEAVRGCIACGSCRKTGKCVFDDLVNETKLVLLKLLLNVFFYCVWVLT